MASWNSWDDADASATGKYDNYGSSASKETVASTGDWNNKSDNWSSWNKKDDNKWGSDDKWKKDDNSSWGKKDAWDNDDNAWDKKGNDWDKKDDKKEGDWDLQGDKERKDWQLSVDERIALDKEDEGAYENLVECTDEVHIIKGPTDGTELECWDTFDKCRTGMPPALVDVMTNGNVASFTAPTTIQAWCWPALMKRADLIGVAKTGSGKTLGFLLPAYIQVKLEEHIGTLNEECPFCLVLAPTRELVQQIFKESEKFGREANIRTCVTHGGSQDRKEQLWKIQDTKPHVLVATPGRLVDYLNKGDLSLESTRIAILDEADRMLDMGFEWEVRTIMDHLPEDRQSLLFSATFPSSVKELAYKFTYRDAIHVQIGSTDPLTGNKDIFQQVEFVDDERQKTDKLYDMVSKQGWDSDNNKWQDGFKMLVFCNSKKVCANLAQRFNDWKIPACELHGDLQQWQRERSLQDFSSGETRLMFATDVASRGLDIPEITSVIIYSPSDSRETHTHRIGRTGRAGKKGIAISLLDKYELHACVDIMATMKKVGQEVPPEVAEVARNNQHGAGRYKRY